MTTHPDPWHPERVVDATLARQLLTEQVPELRLETLEPFGVGWDNTAFLVDDEWVWRFPRRAVAVPGFEAETRLLPALGALLPVAAPDPSLRGSPCDLFPWPFAGYRLLPGETACRIAWTASQRSALAGPLGRFLRALHSVPRELLEPLRPPGDGLRYVDFKRRGPALRDRAERVRSLGGIDARSLIEQLLASLPREPVPVSPVLCHGDLYARHLLVDEHHALVGVIDWGDVHLGHPACDLGLPYGFLPRGSHAEFFKAYGEVTDEHRTLGTLRALQTAVASILYGRDVGDEAMQQQGEATLELLTA